MRNAALGVTRYRIDDREHIELRRALRRFSPTLEILGVYHSHPAGDARPSPTDLADAFYPDWVQVIVGLTPRLQVRAYSIRNGHARNVVLRRSPGDRI